MKGSGKDTIGQFLINQYSAKRVSFADPLKDSVAEEFGIDRSSLDDPARKELPILSMPADPKDGFTRMIAEFMVKEFRSEEGKRPNSFTSSTNQGIFCDHHGVVCYDTVYWTPRALAILKGSTNRSVRSDYWVNKAFDSIDNHLKNNQMVVITDLRYKSEVIQLKEKFGDQVVFVRINRHKESQSTDPSERDLDDHKFDYYLDNTGSLDNTYGQVVDIFTEMAMNELHKETEKLGLEFK